MAVGLKQADLMSKTDFDKLYLKWTKTFRSSKETK